MNTSPRTPAIEVTVTDEGLTLTFGGGAGELALSLSQLTPEIIRHATLHGLKQKLVDAAAISRNTDTGRSATTADKFEAVREVHTRLLAGSWNKGREGGGAARGGLLLRALMEFSGKSREVAEAWLDAKTDAERSALRKSPKIAEIIERLKGPAVGGVDTDALLGELGE